MIKNKQNMDDFLKGSLDNLKIEPSQNVWKKTSKSLLILEIIRFNFSNISKHWLYTTILILALSAGFISYNSLSETPDQTSTINNNTAENNELMSSPKANIIAYDEGNGTTEPKQQTTTTQPHATIEDNDNYKSALQIKESENLALLEDRKDAIPKHPNNAQKREALQLNPIIPTSETDSRTQQSQKTITPIFQQVDRQKPQTEVSQAEIPITSEVKGTKLQKIQSKSIKGSGVKSIYIYEQGGIISIPPLVITNKTKPNKYTKPTTKRRQRKNKSKNSFKKPNKRNKYPNEINEYPSFHISANYLYSQAANYSNYLPQSHSFSIKGGVNYKRFDAKIGIGIQSEQNKTSYNVHYNTSDSVGFFYDIDYYEIIPNNPDSIIIHYTISPIFDTVNHTDLMEIKQKSRWVVLPIELGYEVLKRKSYILAIGLSARFGWEYYRESISTSNIQSITEKTYTPSGATSTNSYITLGIGLENQIKIYKNWWFVIEPRAFFYAKTPYKWENSKNHGPFGFGINTGIRFKF